MTDVLLAVDDSEERARAQAEEIAALDWDVVEVTILHVFTDNVEGASVSQFAPAREARDALEDAGIEVTLAETSGPPGEQVVAYAEETDADLVSVAGRNRSPAGKAVFGSVSQSVMLNTEIPVLYCPVETE
ncbi:universal stress protein [Natronomonas marina]|jgi:nucleotide-binding universal stress UspA family protein|uniref:universal stress protein n=1 Tax=Natronomonas marina TaxID=2961939 RepID=UPI0020CA0908|nr:universal stress protein [Natronomonas marina]